MMHKKILSICIVNKGRKKFLEKTLPVFTKYADEIIIIDTGSLKEVLDFYKKFDIRVYKQKWADDFAKHRNYALKKQLVIGF